MAHHQGARDVAAERACSEQETFGVLDLVEIEGRHDAPAHQLQVQVDCLSRQSAGSSFPDQPKLSRSCETEAASETHLVGSIRGPRSAIRGPSLPFFSHPTVAGLCCDASISSDSTADLSRSCAVIVSLSRTRMRRSVAHGEEARRGVRERKRRRLRTGQPGADGCDDGSDTITVRCVRSTFTLVLRSKHVSNAPRKGAVEAHLLWVNIRPERRHLAQRSLLRKVFRSTEGYGVQGLTITSQA